MFLVCVVAFVVTCFRCLFAVLLTVWVYLFWFFFRGCIVFLIALAGFWCLLVLWVFCVVVIGVV